MKGRWSGRKRCWTCPTAGWTGRAARRPGEVPAYSSGLRRVRCVILASQAARRFIDIVSSAHQITVQRYAPALVERQIVPVIKVGRKLIGMTGPGVQKHAVSSDSDSKDLVRTGADTACQVDGTNKYHHIAPDAEFRFPRLPAFGGQVRLDAFKVRGYHKVGFFEIQFFAGDGRCRINALCGD